MFIFHDAPVTKQRDPDSGQHSLFFQVRALPPSENILNSFHQIDYPEIAEGVRPRHRFMSAYEQRVEPPDRQWQYLLFAAEPYETIAFKVCILLTMHCITSEVSVYVHVVWWFFFVQIPSREVDKAEEKFWVEWNQDTKQFFLQFHFRQDVRMGPPPNLSGKPRTTPGSQSQ